jgi:hypothetical protein
MRSSSKYRSFFIPNTTKEEIESVLDSAAQDVQWTDKEIQQQNRTICYKTPLLDYSGRKIIEITFIPQVQGVQLTIASSFLEQRSYLRFISSLLGGRPYDYFDMYQNNKRNVDYIYDVLQKAFDNVQDITENTK